MPRLSKIGAAALAAFGWTGGASVSASYLVVAGGGGGGGYNNGGGGGAGGYRTGTASLNPTLSYTITVGAGGAGGSTASGVGTVGSNSLFNTITSNGGGGGGGFDGSSSYSPATSGGSGGGGGAISGPGAAGNTPSTSPSQGSNGGNGAATSGGGGGGASAVGSAASGSIGGNGGAGSTASAALGGGNYAGGGGGSSQAGNAGGTASFGGGAGGNGSTNGTSGTSNTGGGGGGRYGGGTGSGGSGGSGIVIISYVGAQQFSGGVVTSSGGNTIHTFTTSGTLGPVTPLSANYLVVAGGGGGGYFGGGGAGGLLSGSALTIDPYSTYLVAVGAGGTGSITTIGASGTNSAFSMVSTTAVGGGGGGSYGSPSGIAALNGGSGGGGGVAENGTPGAPGTGTSGQGNAGGVAGNRGGVGSYPGAGGGGGAGAVGNTFVTTTGGAGGAGLASSISGSSVTYAGGGGGSGYNGTGGAGGAGGGGAGGTITAAAIAGTANTGGGGGGNNATTSSGNGGSGVVIISYAGSTQLMAGGVVTIAGGNVIHTFNSSGFLTPLTLLTRSLRFRSSASAYLNRTPATAGNQKTWTQSFWFKRGKLGVQQVLYSPYYGGDGFNESQMYFNSSDQFIIYDSGATAGYMQYITTQVFRDPAAWYHFVIACDTTQATASNRLKIYVNGVQITAFSTAQTQSQNNNTGWNGTSVQRIGCYARSVSSQIDGYFAEFNNIDGQALAPTAFGTVNSYGVWQPITYGGSYGTNGFRLPFTNNASTTTLGYDFSPQGNNWTTNNISVTAGSTYDSMTDVPTMTSATAANFAVLNPLSKTSGTLVLSDANLKLGDGTVYSRCNSTLKFSSGQWYFEAVLSTAGTNTTVGIGQADITNQYPGQDALSYAQTLETAVSINNNVQPSYGTSLTTGDIFMCAFDLNSNKLFFGKNGTWFGTSNPATGANPVYTLTAGTYGVISRPYGTGAIVNFNFGQRPFTYTPPTGFLALNTFNL